MSNGPAFKLQGEPAGCLDFLLVRWALSPLVWSQGAS